MTVPVAEDAAYDLTITGPDGFEKTFRGVLGCKTAAPGAKPTQAPSGNPSPATTGDPATDGATGSTGSTTTGGDLAETGGSGATPMTARG
ncbi:hypothetical protein ACFWMU_26965 [Streptomyces sp. NPDC058357]|uniref:hypothetical protein n=1 Tax=unclassified Streptomyces TaxID=2593676 RepID=UPI0036621FBF